MSCFNFKRFSVNQSRSAMRVNTDGVLLGAWMEILPSDTRLLDVGTGSGVIAMMAAQRANDLHSCDPDSFEVEITGVDIDAGSVADAAENFAEISAGILQRGCNIEMRAKRISFQDLPKLDPTKKYNLIFSNPPYFINSLKSAGEAKSNARHTDTLNQGDLIHTALQLLAPDGRLALVLPSVEAQEFVRKIEFLASCAKKGETPLRLSRLCQVHTKKTKPAKRWLMEFKLSDVSLVVEHSQLVIQEGGDYTPQYKELTKDFYLNF